MLSNVLSISSQIALIYGYINDKSLGVVYETKLQYEQRVGQKGMDMYKEQHLGCAFFKSFISSDATETAKAAFWGLRKYSSLNILLLLVIPFPPRIRALAIFAGFVLVMKYFEKKKTASTK